ncbi:MAG: MBL fold metallo-hydrolase [Bacteroidetes bacterium]|nr:MBL fold metallo-hydrolase [Bacteroidota bacterium]
MITLQKFVFNTFFVNSYLLYDESRDCILVDASCQEEFEKEQLADFITSNKLNLTHNICTHCHVDHVLGNEFIASRFGILPEYHQKGEPFFLNIREIADSLGFTISMIPRPKGYLTEGDRIKLGSHVLKVLYTPGHAEGSICLYQEEQKFIITGDVLFRDTIGRTDLPSGDYDQLIKSIREKIFTLADDVIVYPGHGPETTIGYERLNNPFVR